MIASEVITIRDRVQSGLREIFSWSTDKDCGQADL